MRGNSEIVKYFLLDPNPCLSVFSLSQHTPNLIDYGDPLGIQNSCCFRFLPYHHSLSNKVYMAIWIVLDTLSSPKNHLKYMEHVFSWYADITKLYPQGLSISRFWYMKGLPCWHQETIKISRVTLFPLSLHGVNYLYRPR